MKRSPLNLYVWSAISLAVILIGTGTSVAFSQPRVVPETRDVLSEPAAGTEAMPLQAQDTADTALADMGRLVGGEWHAPGSPYYHVFEWGVGNNIIHALTYEEDGGALSSEGFWFWEPREETLRGYSIDATGTFFAEMTTRFAGDLMINDLETVTPDGTIERWTGEWRFPDADTYHWVLFKHTDGAREPQFELTFSRSDR